MSGRPTVITPEIVSILIASFHSGLTAREACWQSGISHEAYYNRVRSDELFADTMAKAQGNVTINAKRAISTAIDKGDVSTAKWWLEHRAQKEFGKSKAEDEELPKELQEHLEVLQSAVQSLEQLVCLRYRGILFLEREQQDAIDKNVRGKSHTPQVTNRIDRLLTMTNSQLADYVQLEMYATGKDKADVRQWVKQRSQLLADVTEASR